MLVKLSSKGQLVIPKPIRQDLDLEAGDQLRLEITDNGKIMLEPVRDAIIGELYGRFAGAQFLNDLEAEHQQEIELEPPVRA